MTALPPPGNRQRYSRLGVVLALVAFLLTFGALLAFVRHSPGAAFRFSWLGLAHLATAAGLMGILLWMVGQAYGFRIRTTVAQGVIMGMLADLLSFHGLALLYRPTMTLPAVTYGFLLLASLGAVAMAVTGNAESLRRFRREREAKERDALTGLLNRHGVTRCYAELPAGQPVTVVMLDLNDLKAVNDLGGHSAGDQYIRALSRALHAALPAGAFAGRWGGDEFVAVLPGSADAGALLDAVQGRVPHPERALSPFSYGLATADPGVPLGRMLALADQRMYAQKASTYEAQARRTQPLGGHVGVSEFPHFLLGLDTAQAIVRRGLAKAAELAGFEDWFSLELGTQELTGQFGPGGELLTQVSTFISPAKGLIGEVIRQRQALWAADYEESPYAQPDWVGRGLKSVLVMPVVVGGEVWGVAGFFSHHVWRSVTPQTRQLLETVTIYLGHQLERDAALNQMSASVEATITGMGVLLEGRDLETAGHTQRVVDLALRLGQVAGLDEGQLRALRLGAYLHDIGKLAVPDQILLKPGPLSAPEWTRMQGHSRAGAQMAARLPSVPQEATQVILSHHERWDGHGYPQGLAGEQIPLLARIFALCDVYDALASTRPYKPAWEARRVQAELRAQAGRQFDPRLTALFLDEVLPREAVPVALT